MIDSSLAYRSRRALTAFVVGLGAVMLASWELHCQNKMAARELLWQYRNQLKHFSRAPRSQLQARTLPRAAASRSSPSSARTR